MEDKEKSKSTFIKVKCNDCENEQSTFSKASSTVNCDICGAILVEPTGGLANIKGKVLETKEVE